MMFAATRSRRKRRKRTDREKWTTFVTKTQRGGEINPKKGFQITRGLKMGNISTKCGTNIEI